MMRPDQEGHSQGLGRRINWENHLGNRILDPHDYLHMDSGEREWQRGQPRITPRCLTSTTGRMFLLFNNMKYMDKYLL